MKLQALQLRNFKGIQELSLDLNGQNTSIFGMNATGKTSIFDAVNWLLFGKDSQNKSDFQIKTLDADGKELHNLSHEVEASFEIDGKTTMLRKLYAEKYTKKRGQAFADFTGHTTEYYIDGVPVPKKDYDGFISGIIDESIFKLLTSPLFFNDQLHWQKRRELLLEICGDIADADVIDAAVSAGNKDMYQLLTLLNSGRSLEDHKKVVAARRAEINKELDKIPVRISEVQRNLPDTNGLDFAQLRSEKQFLADAKTSKEAELSRIQNGSEISEKNLKLREIESRLLDTQTKYRSETSDKLYQKEVELRNKRLQADGITETGKVIVKKILEATIAVETFNDKMIDLRKEWKAIHDLTLEYSGVDACPACGQSLPEEQVKAAQDKAVAAFNLKKAQELERVSLAGKKLKAEADALTQRSQQLQNDRAALEIEYTTVCELIAKLQAEIASFATMPGIDSNPDYAKALQEKEVIQIEIEQLQASRLDVVVKLQADVRDLAAKIYDTDTLLAKEQQAAQGKARIDELQTQEKALAAEFEKLEGQLFLCETFIKTKVELLEEKINSKFKLARFVLFSEQINGGLNECCEVKYGGVPFSSLNSAGRIQIGCDIIATLQDHYQFQAPVWIDNRESVVQLPDMNCQVISLVVSEKDKTLRVETEGQKLREVG